MYKPLSQYHFLNLDPETNANPYPYFRRLRAEAPVYREPDYGILLVSRYDDIVKICSDTERFSSIGSALGPYAPLPCPIEKLDEYRRNDPTHDKLLKNDPPEHKKYRALLTKLFLPSRIERMKGKAEALIDRLVDGIIDRESFEFVNEFAYLIPRLMVGELLGVPEEDTMEFYRAMSCRYDAMDGSFVGNPNGPVNGPANFTELTDYFEQALLERRRLPKGDVLSELANTTFPNGEPVAAYDLVQLCAVLYGAGGDANSPQTLTNGIQILAENPEMANRLRCEPDLIDNFIEELLRFEPPNLGRFRYVRQEGIIGDVSVRPGDCIMVLFASGNRDELYYDDPDEFQLLRRRRRILTFGSGPHLCIGAPLARIETGTVFRKLLHRLTNIRVATPREELRYLPSVLLRSVRSLELSFTPS